MVLIAALCVESQHSSRVTISRSCANDMDWSDLCVITLEEGLDTTVALTLDEPIICASRDHECSVIVNISNSNANIVTVDPCHVHWKRLEWHQTRTVRVSIAYTLGAGRIFTPNF